MRYRKKSVSFEVSAAVLAVVVLVLLAGIGLETVAARDEVPEESAVTALFGTTMQSGPSRTPVRLAPDAVAVAAGSIYGIQRLPVLASVVDEEPHQPHQRHRWALVDLAGVRGSAGLPPFGWVSMRDLRAPGETGERSSAPASRDPASQNPVEIAVNRFRPRVLLHRAPVLGEEPLPVFYIDLETGEQTIVTTRYHESRIVAFLPESEVLVTSVGTGLNFPEPIFLSHADTGETFFSGYTWELFDAVGDERYVRVIPAEPGQSWESAPGYRREPPEAILRGTPWFFDDARLEHYRSELARIRGNTGFSLHIVPHVWIDTVTGEVGPVEFSVERMYRQ